MSPLFSPFQIKGLQLRNRFVRSATYDGTADEEGRATEASVAIIQDLARGGVGLIVTGHAFVSPSGQANPGQYGVHTDEMIPGLRRLAQAAHSWGARIALQISHSGFQSRYLSSRGTTALAPSPVEGIRYPHREMAGEEVLAIIRDFGAAAARAREAGFDAVQLHGAHGYLTSEFFSPLFNRRTDEWGGTPENRRRFHIQMAKEVRRRVGPDFPLLMKFGVMDDAPGGATLEEGLQTARELEAAGLDALEISAGSRGRISPAQRPSDPPEAPYFKERTSAVKKAVGVPVIEVGGIRSPEMARMLIDAGEADLIALSRPLIREPGLIARWERGDQAPARCISCSKCFGVIERDGALGCFQERYPQEAGHSPA